MRRKREWITFDLTPLIDIVFLLLIFFMVFSVFKKNETILDINLPQSKVLKEKSLIKNTLIELNTKEVSLNGKKTTFEELALECITIDSKELIVLSIDKDVRYEKIVDLIDILKEKRLENISLLVKK